MGAYIFTKDPPFQVLRISKVPILIDEFYQGVWHNQNCDFVVFPAGAFLTYEEPTLESAATEKEVNEGDKQSKVDPFNELTRRTIINLSVGKNDVEGWVVKIRLDDLLDSLVPFKLD